MNISIPGVIAQILNFGILFFLLKKYLTAPIINALEERKSLIKKLEKAEEVYEKKIQEAKEKSEIIISEAKKKKEAIIVDAGVLAEKKKSDIIESANYQANKVMKEADEKIEMMQKNLESSYEDAIKKTSKLVLKKLIKNSPEIKEAYIKESISELKK